MKIIKFLIAGLLFLSAYSTHAAAPYWVAEVDYEQVELNGVIGVGTGASGKTNGQENISLGFNFPFAGNSYTRISVDSDGGLVLRNDTTTVDISQTIWSGNFQSGFINPGSGSPAPVILPFGASLSQSSSSPKGEVWFATYGGSYSGFTGDRAIVTWERSSLLPGDTTVDISFQVQMFDDGTIIFSYDTLTDPAGFNWNTRADSGFVVGVSKGDGAFPSGSIDYSAVDFGSGTTVYQIWCKNENPVTTTTCAQTGLDKNDAFDLDDVTLVFNPDGSTGFLVSDSIKDGTGGSGLAPTCYGSGVGDTTPPVVTPPVNIALNTTNPAGIPASNASIVAFLAGSTAIDAVDPSPGFTHDAPATFSPGATVVRFTYTDASGNAGSATASVTVVLLGSGDTTPPVVTPPVNIALNTTNPAGIPASNASIVAFLAGSTAIDAVDPSPGFTHDAPATFSPGATVVRFTYTDVSGNVGNATASVTVVVLTPGNTPPPVVKPVDNSLNTTNSSSGGGGGAMALVIVVLGILLSFVRLTRKRDRNLP